MKTVIPAQKKSGLAQYPYYPVQQSYRDVRLSEVGSEINQNKYRTPIVIAIVLGFFGPGSSPANISVKWWRILNVTNHLILDGGIGFRIF